MYKSKKCEILNKMIFEIELGISDDGSLRVTLVFVKESWGIRISLNTIRSTQVFNEILWKIRIFIVKRYLIKCGK